MNCAVFEYDGTAVRVCCHAPLWLLPRLIVSHMLMHPLTTVIIIVIIIIIIIFSAATDVACWVCSCWWRNRCGSYGTRCSLQLQQWWSLPNLNPSMRCSRSIGLKSMHPEIKVLSNVFWVACCDREQLLLAVAGGAGLAGNACMVARRSIATPPLHPMLVHGCAEESSSPSSFSLSRLSFAASLARWLALVFVWQ